MVIVCVTGWFRAMCDTLHVRVLPLCLLFNGHKYWDTSVNVLFPMSVTVGVKSGSL